MPSQSTALKNSVIARSVAMLSGTMLRLEGTHALGADFLLNIRMAVLRVEGGERGEPDLDNQLRVNR